MNFDVALIGKKEVLAKLANLSKEGKEAAQEVVYDTASATVRHAKRLAPLDNGELRRGIGLRKDDSEGLSATVYSEAPHSGYVEFGTGPQVRIPPEFMEMAAKYKGGKGGSFQEGLANIRRWCKKKGIDEKYAWVIFMNILRRGLRARPFFYPAYRLGLALFEKRMREALNRLKL